MLTASGAPSGWRVVDVPERGTTYAYVGPSPTASAETVVLLHGWTATGASNWAATITALEERYRVVALDHRGHGRGIRGADPFSLEDCADDVVALLDGLGVRSAIFVGYSMGGPIAQLIWRRHPRFVHGLILLATAADFTSTPGYEPLEDIVEHVWKASGLIRQSLQPVTKHVSELLVAAPIGL